MVSSNKVDTSLAKDSVRVVISKLATTKKAALRAASSDIEFPQPGLNSVQMDSFIKIGNRMNRLGSLTSIEVCHAISFQTPSD